MLCNPTIEVLCDGNCGISILIGITATARGYDERNVEADILDERWAIDGDNHYCEDCEAHRKRTIWPGIRMMGKGATNE